MHVEVGFHLVIITRVNKNILNAYWKQGVKHKKTN